MDAGELVIKTVMDNDKFEKQYKQLENRYKNKQIDLEITTGDLQREQDELERLNKEGEKLQVTYGKIKKEKQQWQARKLEVSTEIAPNTFRIHDEKAYNEAINKIQKLSNEESKVLDSIIMSNDETVKQEQVVEKITAKYEKQKNDLNLIKENVADLQYKSQQIEFNKVTSSIKAVGKEIGKSIKQITRMGLAIFGIRSAYYMIRSAINDIGKSNKNVTDTIQYAKSMLSTALEPVVISIVNWLKQALAYINALVKAWFKRDLFKETNANLKKANKQASALKKTLAGFDEMNILNSPSTGGGGGISSSDLGLPSVEETGVFGWILNNKDLVIAALTGITTALITTKLLGLQPLQGIFLAITTSGIMLFVENLIKAFNDPSWGTILNVMGGLEIAIGGIVGLLTPLLPALGPAGWIIAGVSILVGALSTLIGHLRDSKEATFDLQNAEKNLADARANRQNAEKQYIQSLKNHKEAIKNLEKAQKDNGISIEEVLKKMEEEGLTYEQLDKYMKPVYESYLDEQLALKDTETWLKKVNEEKKNEALESLNVVAGNAKEKKSYQELFAEVDKLVENGTITTDEAKKYLETFFQTLDKQGRKTFKEQLPDYFNSSKKEIEKLKKELQNLYNVYDKMSRAHSFRISVSSSSSTSTKGAKGLVYYDRLPKLAVGGIVNQPGRGIPYRGATIAERGAEAIVPLTDTQQMQLLGESIGRFITVMNTNPIYMNGRLIAKEINRSNAEDDFAFNR